jgi:hypothetical protein
MPRDRLRSLRVQAGLAGVNEQSISSAFRTDDTSYCPAAFLLLSSSVFSRAERGVAITDQTVFATVAECQRKSISEAKIMFGVAEQANRHRSQSRCYRVPRAPPRTVPLVNPELSENMGFAYFHKPPPIDVLSAARAGWRPLVFVPHTRRSSIRKAGPPPPDRCPPALSQEATEADCGRPYSVGLAVRSLQRLATCPRHRQARNCHCMAPEGLWPFLDMQDPTRPSRTASSSKRGPLSLGKDAPEPRAVQSPEIRRVVAVPQVGGLHHRYERRAA